MTTRQTRRRSTAIAGALATLMTTAALTILVSAAPARFYDDDPVWVERDTEDASGMKPLEIDLIVDLTYNLFGKPGDRVPGVRAKNVNTVDEVPDSSWFTNRAGRRPLTPKEMTIGPDTTAGPGPGRWIVTASKSDGVTPGFTIRNPSGELWFLKFDPRGYRAMATGTEVAVTKLMWALGYHVPENHIAYMRREQLEVGDGAKVDLVGGRSRAMRLTDVDLLLERADREPNGSYRIVASKALQGTPIGRIRFYGTRPDDPNDIVPHEHRRELRGYGVFAAWLNHVDAKAINSRDMLVTAKGRAFVRHNLLDFGSTLGSGGVGPADYWAGSEHLVEPRGAAKQALGFGFSFPRWHTTDFYEAPSIGRLPRDNTRFDPDLWKPRVPNQAFLHARPDDKFWAAQRLVALNDALLQAAVRAVDFGDPNSEEILVKILAERRDAIGRAYLTAINPIAVEALERAGALTFRNVAVDAGFAKAPAGYQAIWSTFDNASGSSQRLGETTGSALRLEAPAALPTAPGTFVKIEISATGGAPSSWQSPVHAYFRRAGDGEWRLVGFERMPETQQ